MARIPNDGLGYQNWPYPRPAGQDRKYFPHDPNRPKPEPIPIWRKDHRKFIPALVEMLGLAAADQYLRRQLIGAHDDVDTATLIRRQQFRVTIRLKHKRPLPPKIKR